MKIYGMGDAWVTEDLCMQSNRMGHAWVTED